MRATIFAIMLGSVTAWAQTGSINNTLGTGGSFTIKDNSTTFVSLNQADGYWNLARSLTLPVTDADASLGVVFKGTERFIHDFKGSGTDGLNTFVGVNSGNFTMSMGSSSAEASHNTAVGHSSLSSLTSGFYNSAFGYAALNANTTGQRNSAFGRASLVTNTTGSTNAAFGAGSLFSNTEGSNNSAVGSLSLSSNTTGNYNSAFGYDAGSSITTGTNNICIGYNAQVPDGTASNQVQIGNASVGTAYIEVGWTTPSDRRIKSDIRQSDLGLEFVSKLNPVSYIRQNDEKGRTEYGFIAQEVEDLLNEANVDNAGMLLIDQAGKYGLRYNDFLAPIVKAIQELKGENDRLKEELGLIRAVVAGPASRSETKKGLTEVLGVDDSADKVSLH